MRLLKHKDNSEFSLIEFIGDKIPRYAILSYTWRADDEEVTFKDLIKGTSKSLNDTFHCSHNNICSLFYIGLKFMCICREAAQYCEMAKELENFEILRYRFQGAGH
jgi:hypothetical protein